VGDVFATDMNGHETTFQVLDNGSTPTVKLGYHPYRGVSVTIPQFGGGHLDIPNEVQYLGVSYTIEKIGEYAFSGANGYSNLVTIPPNA